tara:strand:+ start:101 stop:604 length:504 start_codon:yes stop_codon:yes gene_type:complete
MNIKQLIDLIEKKIKDPKKSLPEDIFLLLSRISPLVNVDLLIKNKKNQILLTWRQKGQVYPEGWHIPGGIIRYKEKFTNRIKEVAKNELNCKINFNDNPIEINQIFLNQKNRGHFISLLFECKLITNPSKKIEYVKGNPNIGEWMWHSKCPKELIIPHKIYKKYFKK